MELVQFFQAGVFKRREYAEKLAGLGQYFILFKNGLVFKAEQFNTLALKGFSHCDVPVNRCGFIVLVCEHGLYAQFRRQFRDCRFGVVVYQVQIAAKALKLCLKRHAAFPDKLHTAIGFVGQGIQNGFVKHEHAMHLLAMFQGIKKGGIVMGSQVAPEPHQSFGVLARLGLGRQWVVFKK